MPCEPSASGSSAPPPNKALPSSSKPSSISPSTPHPTANRLVPQCAATRTKFRFKGAARLGFNLPCRDPPEEAAVRSAPTALRSRLTGSLTPLETTFTKNREVGESKKLQGRQEGCRCYARPSASLTSAKSA